VLDFAEAVEVMDDTRERDVLLAEPVVVAVFDAEDEVEGSRRSTGGTGLRLTDMDEAGCPGRPEVVEDLVLTLEFHAGFVG